MNRPSIAFEVFGIAEPKGSARAFMPKGARFPVVTSDNPNLKGWERTIRGELQRVMKQTDGATLAAIFSAPVAVGLRFHLPRPKSKKKAKYPVTKPDVDKLARCAKDALTKVVWTDDAQVVELRARKRYVEAGKFPRAEIVVRERTEVPHGLLV